LAYADAKTFILILRYFTWDNLKFPNPVEMQNAIAAKGRKMVTIIDPHIKVDNNYHIYRYVI